MKIDQAEVMFKFKFKDDDKFPATMTLCIGDLEVRGFSVRRTLFEENKTPFVIFPPASRAGKGWIKIFYTANKDLWNQLQDCALEQFDKEHSDYLLKIVAGNLG